MADDFKNARLSFVKVGSTTFAAELSSSFSITPDLIETTNKSSTTSKSFVYDIYGATASANTLMKVDTSTGAIESLAKTFYTTATSDSAATLIFVLQASGPTTTLSVSAHVSEWTVTATQGNVIEGNFSFQCTGDVTLTETST